MRQDSSDIYLHAQLFTGFMYIGAALCMWFLRAWKIQELARLKESKEQRERDIRDDDAVVRPNLSRHASRISVKDTVKVAKGLWSWQRV